MALYTTIQGPKKYQAVGSTSVSDGIASNFSTSNHLLIQNASLSSDFDAQFSFTTGDDITGVQTIVHFGYAFNLETESTTNGIRTWNGNNQVTICPVSKLAANTKYVVRVTRQGTSFSATYSINDGAFSSAITWTNSGTQSTSSWLGNNVNHTNQFFKGSINLHETYVLTNNQPWFGPCPVRARIRCNNVHNAVGYRIHQDNFSKYYTIVDGKLTWASPDIRLIHNAGVVQYITTNYIPNTNSVVHVTFSFDEEPEVSDSHRYTILSTPNGHYNNSEHPDCFTYTCWHSSANGYASWFYIGKSGGAQSYTLQMYPRHRYKATVSGTSATNQQLIDVSSGTTLQNFNNVYSFDGSNRSNLRIFGNGTNNTADYGIHQVIITENGNILGHFVPVPKGLLIGNFIVPSNGMFDIVSQTFYGNAGSGEFKIGGIPNDYIIEGGKMLWCNPNIYLGMEQGTSYSVSSYLKTTLRLTSQSKVYSIINPVRASVNWFLWCNRSNVNSFSYSFANVNAHVRFDYYSTQTTGQSTPYNTKFKVTMDKNKFYIDDVLKHTVTAVDFTTQYDLILFASNTNGGSVYGNPYSGLVYNFIAYVNGVDISMYLVPVPLSMTIGAQTATSNCMFDLVTQTFFTNQGSGSFTYGSD